MLRTALNLHVAMRKCHAEAKNKTNIECRRQELEIRGQLSLTVGEHPRREKLISGPTWAAPAQPMATLMCILTGTLGLLLFYIRLFLNAPNPFLG